MRFLARRKANYSAKDYRRFTYKNGVLVPDDVAPMTGLMGHLREQAIERVVMDGLKKLTDLSVRATAGANSPSYLPRQLLEYKLADGHGKAEIAAAMRRLRLTGQITEGVVGKYPNRTPMMGLMIVEPTHK